MSDVSASAVPMPTVLGVAQAKQRQRTATLMSLSVLLGLSVVMALGVGQVDIPLSHLLNLPSLVIYGADTMMDNVLLHLRLPRVVLGVMVGAGLGLSGAVLQILLRNPLADPGLIGVSSGAAVGAGTFFVFGGTSVALGSSIDMLGLPFAAFLGAVATLFLVLAIGQRGGEVNVARILLAGIAINAIAGAVIGLFSFVSDDAQLRSLTFWMLGSVSSAGWREVFAVSAVLVVFGPFMFLPAALSLYGLGDATARSMGVDAKKLKWRMMVCVAAIVGAAVSVSGTIGFVGLVVPHALRLCGGAAPRILLPGSALLGASTLVIADSLARSVLPPADVPIGILTGLVGGPFFIWLLMRQRRAHNA